ncbi:MAG: hypothetical protein MUF10_00855 [Thermoanaerobaculaceae bacterium]|jgi:hypothetical protein|nr:hypothetical protein [Thermoanaerobaculaceae bacterium]
MKARDARSWTAAALFGSLWGAAELSLGALLSAARVPLGGLLMASLGVVCMVTARRLHPAPGQSLAMGVVVAFLKVFSVGGMVLGPVVGILTEALLVEVAFLLLGLRPGAALVGGAAALASAPSWMLLWASLLTGPEAVRAVERGMRSVASAFGWPGATPLALVASLVGLAGVLGAAAGALAWRVAGRVVVRVRGTS